MRTFRTWFTAGCSLAAASLAVASLATAAPWPELTRSREIELATSAAPEHLRAAATVYVMGANGFEKAREGTNGFSCLVNREGQVFAPVCYDQEGSRTTLLAELRKGQLLAKGKSEKEARAIIEKAYEAGELQAPQSPGIAYMLSPDFVRVDPETGEAHPVFAPHLMFYAPYMSNEDIGAIQENIGSKTQPWILNPGKPNAYIIVVPPETGP